MRSLARLLAVVAVGLATATAGAAPALAHGGEEGLVVEPAAAAAGSTVSVRGDLPTTSPVELVLVGSHAERLVLASVADPADGHFETVVTLPPAAAPGTWRLQALVGGAPLAEHEVGILAAAAPAEDGRDDRAEPVAAPVAAPAAASSGAIRPDAAALQAPVADRPSQSRRWALSALGVAVVAGAVALGVTSTVRRRRAAPV
jgi:hypothetical protein